MIIKMFNELGRRMDEHSGKVNKELIKYKEEPNRHKEYITQIKNTLGGSNSRLDNTQDWIKSKKEDRVMEITQAAQKKQTEFLKEWFKKLLRKHQVYILTFTL